MNLALFQDRINGIFEVATDEASVDPWIDALSWKVESMSAEETYGALEGAAGLSEWEDGPRAIRSFTEELFKVPNKDFADAVEISQKNYRRRKWGEFERQVAEMGRAAVTHPNEYASDVIKGFDSQLVYDGQFYFDTDHQSGDSGVQSNILTQTGTAVPTAPTPLECSNAVIAAAVLQRGFKAFNGRPWSRGGSAQFIVMVPTTILASMVTGLNSALLTDGAGTVDNPITKFSDRFSFTVVDNPDMDATWGTGNKQFGLFRVDGAGNVLIFQEEVPVTPDDTAVNAYELFHNKRLVFGVQRAYRILGLHWHKGIRVDFAA